MRRRGHTVPLDPGVGRRRFRLAARGQVPVEVGLAHVQREQLVPRCVDGHRPGELRFALRRQAGGARGQAGGHGLETRVVRGESSVALLAVDRDGVAGGAAVDDHERHDESHEADHRARGGTDGDPAVPRVPSPPERAESARRPRCGDLCGIGVGEVLGPGRPVPVPLPPRSVVVPARSGVRGLTLTHRASPHSGHSVEGWRRRRSRCRPRTTCRSSPGRPRRCPRGQSTRSPPSRCG